MNKYYLKKKNGKIYVDKIVPEEEKLSMELVDLDDLDQIKSDFSNLSDITIYTAIVQDDGRETDEIVYMYFSNLTKLSKVSYDIKTGKYSVILIEPEILEERITELEDAVNYILFGGEE